MTHRPEHHPIRSRIDQRAKELLADTQGMEHRASNLAAPDLPRRVEDCPQADVGLCCPQEHKSEPRPPTQRCQGLAGRSTRLAVFGQPEDQLWRGARPAVGRRGTRPRPRILENPEFFENWVKKADEISSATRQPENVDDTIWADYLQVLGDVRRRTAENAKQIVQSTRGCIRNLHATRERPTIPHRAICLRKLGQLSDMAADRAKAQLEREKMAQKERLSWFDDVELRRVLGEDDEVFIRTSPPYKYGWRTGVEAIRGKKATVELAYLRNRKQTSQPAWREGRVWRVFILLYLNHRRQFFLPKEIKERNLPCHPFLASALNLGYLWFLLKCPDLVRTRLYPRP